MPYTNTKRHRLSGFPGFFHYISLFVFLYFSASSFPRHEARAMCMLMGYYTWWVCIEESQNDNNNKNPEQWRPPTPALPTVGGTLSTPTFPLPSLYHKM